MSQQLQAPFPQFLLLLLHSTGEHVILLGRAILRMRTIGFGAEPMKLIRFKYRPPMKLHSLMREPMKLSKFDRLRHVAKVIVEVGNFCDRVGNWSTAFTKYLKIATA